MKKTNLLLVSAALFCSYHSFAQSFYGKDAESRIQDATHVQYSERFAHPTFIEFKSSPSNFRMAVSNPLEAMKELLALKATDGFISIKQENDDIGFTHTRYQQVYKNIPVEGAIYIAHQKSGVLNCINGAFVNIGELSVSPGISESAALSKALDFVGAKKYYFNDAEAMANIHAAFGDQNISFEPTGELVVYGKNGALNDRATFRLAYKFNIFASQPESRANIFVDAQTGEIIGRQELIHTADVTGTAHTKYSGTQTIKTTLVGSNYVLRETERGVPKGSISTYNGKKAYYQDASYPAIDFTDADNDWNNVNADLDEAATDAHWATEMTYDYYYNMFSRKSYDNKNTTLVNYIHITDKDANGNVIGWFNANWNGSFMRYGDGPGVLPLTAIDIGAHEMTHGVTGESAGLQYKGESGALNESFSDIFGTCVEFAAKPTKANWQMGEDVGALRDLQYPKSHGNPDTYQGVYWANTADLTQAGDNGGVHTNSGVQNHWFFILTNGEDGVNDNNVSYAVKGIGIDKAARIAYKSLTTYLGPTSDYAEARTNSLKAATDLYGSCSPEYVAVAYAWDAVGVTGTISCAAALPVAGFSSTVQNVCDGTIQFKDLSVAKAPATWAWDFGDGQTSTDQNPVHKYAKEGTFDVKLTTTNGAGSDSKTKTAFVTIKFPKGPAGVNAQRCGPGVVDLTATGANGNNVNWYAAGSGGVPLSTGNKYSPNLSTTTTFYVENTIDASVKKVGAVDSNAVGRGGMFSANFAHGLYFDALSPLIIKTVKVYAGSAGDRLIEVVDGHGDPIVAKTINIAKGESRIQLDFDLPAGNQYFLKVTGKFGAKLDLQRGKSGATYPYTIAGLISITETDFKAVTPGIYYFFYDWEVQRSGCIGPRTEVKGTINPDVPKPVITESNKTLSASVSGLTYEWYLNGTLISGATGQTYKPVQDGNYTVKAIGVGNCSNTSDGYQFISNGINVSSLDATVKVYPNPVNDLLYVEAPLTGNNVITVGVYSVIGKLIYQETYTNSGQPHLLNLSAVDANGIYFIKLQSGSETVTRKFNLNR